MMFMRVHWWKVTWSNARVGHALQKPRSQGTCRKSHHYYEWVCMKNRTSSMNTTMKNQYEYYMSPNTIDTILYIYIGIIVDDVHAYALMKGHLIKCPCRSRPSEAAISGHMSKIPSLLRVSVHEKPDKQHEHNHEKSIQILHEPQHNWYEISLIERWSACFGR